MANRPIPTGLQIVGSKASKRIPRYPSHSFNIRHLPFQIQPFCIAPVLAGETLKNLNLQARVVTDPVRNRLIGWWIEHYYFYVKLTDLADRDDAKEMLMDMTASMPTDAVASVKNYHRAGVNWTQLCMDRIVDEYFRDEGDALSTLIDGMYSAQLQGKDWSDSVYTDAEVPSATLGENPIDAETFEGQYRTWEYMRNMGLTEATYEDYLSAFGIRNAKAEEAHKPELIRFSRNWQYPSNTVDPTTGAATSAVSWSIAERADKDRFFKEPGFIVGVTVARPKVYMSNQLESASHLLDNAFAWLPATLKDDVASSLKKITKATGLLGGVHTASDYWVDVRDLFVHGDQFVNFSLADTVGGLVALPTAVHTTARYPTKAMVDLLFTGAVGGKVEQDGITSFNILGTQQDYT